MFDWIIDWIYSQFEGFRAWVLELIANIQQNFYSFYNYFTNVYQTVVNYIGDVYQTIVNNVTNIVNNVVNNITNTVNNIVQNITNFVTNVVNNVTEVIQNITQNVTQVIGVTIEKVGEWFANIGGATRAWVDGLFIKADNVWDTITGNLDEWGKSLLIGINDTFGWIQEFHNDLEGFFTNPLDWLWSKFADWFLGE